MLALQEQADLHATDVMRAARWKKVEPLAKSYIGNSIHLLGARRRQPQVTALHSTRLASSDLSFRDSACGRGACLRERHFVLLDVQWRLFTPSSP